MAQKPTYEELEQRVRELEKAARECHNTCQKLKECEERANALLNAPTDSSILLDTNGIILAINPIAAERIEKEIDELLGMSIFDLLPPDLAKSRKAKFDKVVRTGKPERFEDIRAERIFDSHVYPVFDSDGKIIAVAVFAREITKKKKAQEALSVSEQKYKNIFNNILDGYYRADLEGNLISVSPSSAKIMGYEKPEDLIGRNLATEFYADPHEREALRKDIMKHGKIRFQGTLKRKDGTLIVTETNSRLIYDDKKGEPIAIEGIFRDISQRILAEEKLKKSEKEYRALAGDLEVKTKSLEELNTAMKVLLEKRKEDRIKLEDNVLKNTNELIEPLIVNMRETKLNEHQKMILSIIESNLDEISSNFTRKLSMKHLNLTPTEMKIANLIKHGTTTKKIAEIMKSSPRTIETHRKNIREKIGLKQNRRNLRSYLLSLH